MRIFWTSKIIQNWIVFLPTFKWKLSAVSKTQVKKFDVKVRILWTSKIIKNCTVFPGSLGNLLKKFFQPSKCSLLDRKSNIAKSQFLKIWFFDHFWANYNYGNAKTSIRGCTSTQIKTLRPYFSIFSITVVRLCLRKQQSKSFTNMLTTPSIEPVNIWFDSASPCF